MARRKGGGGAQKARKFTPEGHGATAAGQKLTELARQLDAETSVLQLQGNPNALAPERLLVFELTGTILEFEKAVRLVPGLEFLGVEDLEPDVIDKRPSLYLMVPSDAALRNIVTLWQNWRRTGKVPRRFSAWKAMLSQLRDIRRWGPQDRITEADTDILTAEADVGAANVRVEVELVFRPDGTEIEGEARGSITARGGTIISAARIGGAGYHALLADIPTQALRDALLRRPNSLTMSDAVFQIRPQSVSQAVALEEVPEFPAGGSVELAGEPIAAIFDGVPLAGHPRLAGTLSLDDPFALEALAVGPRGHGTAMASAVVHGDLNQMWDRPLERRVHFVSMMYATPDPEHRELFPDRLPADMFEQAIVGMREGASPTAPHVIIINVSLGDANKAFANRISGWARVVDYLASKYGILFVISAGNHLSALETPNVNATQFEALTSQEKMRSALRASAAQIAMRRVLAPAEAVNGITVGALHADSFVYPNQLPVWTFDVWANSGLCTISSGLGPGYGGATKPDILAPGGKHHVRLMPHGDHHRLQPLERSAATFGGIAVAAPQSPTSLSPNVVARSVGSSVAAALATGVATRAHEALEAAYPDFVSLPSAQRAALLKALLVHGARWTHARDLLIEILGPDDTSKHYRQKDNVRRYLGFGAYDPELVINCANDRATLWAVGTVNADEGKRFQIPWPDAMTGKPQPHGVFATLAWFSPPRPGAVAYRAVRMKIVELDQMGNAGISATGLQPDPKQAHRGTVVHRRWDGEDAAAIAANGFITLDIQREKDELEQPTHFAVVATLEMPGEAQVYTQVLNRVGIKPRIAP